MLHLELNIQTMFMYVYHNLHTNLLTYFVCFLFISGQIQNSFPHCIGAPKFLKVKKGKTRQKKNIYTPLPLVGRPLLSGT